MKVGMWTVLAAIALVGCDNPNPTHGLTVTEDAKLVLLYRTCKPDAYVQGIRVTAGDNVVWHIEKANLLEDTKVEEFVIGEVPPGFVERVQWNPEMASNSVLVYVKTSSSKYEFSERLELGDARPNEILVPRRGYMSVEKYRTRSACDGGGLVGGCR
jgi:hypothetical protein